MKYEIALKNVRYYVPKTIQQVIEKGERAEDTLKSIRQGSMTTVKKCFHAYRRIAEEGRKAKEKDYVMPELINYKGDIESIVALQTRFKTALDDFSILADNHFNMDPDNISDIKVDLLLDLLFTLEACTQPED